MNLKNEYDDFLNSQNQQTTKVVSIVEKEISDDLALFPRLVFTKVLLIHLCVALVTLIFCPQFGVGPFGGEKGLMSLFMVYGPFVCTVLCSLVFFGTSAIVTGLFLQKGEGRFVCQKHLVLISSVVVFLSFSFLLAVRILLSGWSGLGWDLLVVWPLFGGIFFMSALFLVHRFVRSAWT